MKLEQLLEVAVADFHLLWVRKDCPVLVAGGVV